jgi:hypothetical protein
MQMLLVAIILPSLVLMSRTKTYPMIRIGGEVFAGAALIGWIAGRLLNVKTPVDILLHQRKSGNG